MARPKKVSDEDMLRAAYDLTMEYGPHGLTFNRLATRVGLVPAALVRRFASKQQLLAEVDRFALARTKAVLQDTLERHDSPIDAIIASLTTEMAFASTTERFINGQSFLLFDLADPELYANYQISFRERHAGIARLLRQAQARQEIISDVDCDDLARLLQTILQGCGHTWVMTQESPIEIYIEDAVRFALRPYMIKKAGLAPKIRKKEGGSGRPM